MSPSVPLCLLQTQTDARLVELARGGHERAFEALVQRYRKPLLSYCRRLLLPESRAEDAVQQALVQAWLALRDGEQVREPRAWLYRVVHNAAISALRRSGYDYVELDESIHGELAPESDIDRRIAVREALAGLAALPEAQREVLLRTAVQGHSHEQVAGALGLSDGAVRGLIYRARATLRAAATAVTPPQIAIWAARAAEGASHPQVSEIVAGGGSAGLLGVLLKGGAVVLSAGALATGATIVQHSDGAPSTAQADPVSRLVHRQALTSAGPFAGGGLSRAIESDSQATLGVGSGQHRGSARDRRRSRGDRHSGRRSGNGGGEASGGDSRGGGASSGRDRGGEGSGGSGRDGGGTGGRGSSDRGGGSGSGSNASGTSGDRGTGGGGGSTSSGDGSSSIAGSSPSSTAGSGGQGGGDGGSGGSASTELTTALPAPQSPGSEPLATSGSGGEGSATQSGGGGSSGDGGSSGSGSSGN